MADKKIIAVVGATGSQGGGLCAAILNARRRSEVRLIPRRPPGVFDGAIDRPSVLAYVEQILVPTLHVGDLVIADNLSAHECRRYVRHCGYSGAKGL